MSPAKESEIAIIDISPLLAASTPPDPTVLAILTAQIQSACTDTGCFYLTGFSTILPDKSLTSIYTTIRQFFTLPLSQKLLSISTNNPIGRGYFPFETENVNAFMGRKSLPNDPVEKFGIGPVDPPPNPTYLSQHPNAADWWAPNIWPVEPPEFQTSIERYYRAMKRIAEMLMGLFSSALGMPQDFVARHFEMGGHSLKMNYYPRVEKPKQGQDRFPEHTDSPPFTLLSMDDTQDSLHVHTRTGKWTPIQPISGTLFVNLGDTMARWTNDRWVATPHKVLWTPKPRLSMAFFAVPNYDTKLTCVPSCLKDGEEPRYPSMTLHEYVEAKCRAMMGGEGQM